MPDELGKRLREWRWQKGLGHQHHLSVMKTEMTSNTLFEYMEWVVLREAYRIGGRP